MRSPRFRLLAVLPALAIVAAACGGGGGSPGREAAATAGADSLLAFSAPMLTGGDLAGASLQGHDSVLWFWAPWCTVCRAEAPSIVAAAEDLAGEVRLIGVAGRGEVSEMKAFVEETGTDSLTHVVDGDGKIWSSFGVFAQPAFAFIDDGGDVEVFVGSLGHDDLTERMRQLAAG